MPVTSRAQWRLMSAIEHGWKPTHMKHPPSKKVAHEYTKHGKPKRLPERKHKRKSLLSGG